MEAAAGSCSGRKRVVKGLVIANDGLDEGDEMHTLFDCQVVLLMRWFGRESSCLACRCGRPLAMESGDEL